MNRDSRRNQLMVCLPQLLGYLRKLTQSRQVAGELLQEVSVRILAGDAPDDAGRFLAWSLGIARHVFARDWRMRKRERDVLPLEADLLERIRTPQSDPEGRIDARDWMSRMNVFIDHDGLELLVRRYVLEETGSELAGELDQSSAALRMRLMRLRSRLHRVCPRAPRSTV